MCIDGEARRDGLPGSPTPRGPLSPRVVASCRFLSSLDELQPPSLLDRTTSSASPSLSRLFVVRSTCPNVHALPAQLEMCIDGEARRDGLPGSPTPRGPLSPRVERSPPCLGSALRLHPDPTSTPSRPPFPTRTPSLGLGSEKVVWTGWMLGPDVVEEPNQDMVGYVRVIRVNTFPTRTPSLGPSK
jgi:hypothetical protein